MKKIFACLALLIITSCSTEPEGIDFGVDVCHACKMTLIDQKFGAELVTQKGKIYKFDDLRCLLAYMGSSAQSETYEHTLVVDFASHGKLINAVYAHYVESPEIRSPMDGQLAAFSSEMAMDTYKKQWNGNHLKWEEVIAKSN